MKTDELLENMDPLFPADFLSCSFPISSSKFTLIPDMSNFLDEEKFSSFYIKWSEEGIEGMITVEQSFEGCFFPEYQKGDSIEIFIDTRDHKKSAFATRFCHHFVFLPAEVNGVRAEEVTKFRLDDSHPLCNSSDLKVSPKIGKKSYEISFFISESALHGYDPSQFSRIGFAYKINRLKAPSQHFPISSKAFDLLDNPSLWASCQLI